MLVVDDTTKYRYIDNYMVPEHEFYYHLSKVSQPNEDDMRRIAQQYGIKKTYIG